MLRKLEVLGNLLGDGRSPGREIQLGLRWRF
jgi:hypothetical protein